MMVRNRNPLRGLAAWWELQRMPMLDWIQVEVTTRCNASCLYCPRTAYGSSWANRDLTPETLRALAPYFATARMVHLQGWGESLLHPAFFEMVGLARKAGCRVSTATNGMLVDRETASRLVACGIDDVAFSLAGIGTRNDDIRRGTAFESVLRAIGRIQSAKRELRSETPALNVAYMLLGSDIPSLAQMVPALQGRGIENVIVSTLDFVPSRSLAGERIAPGTREEYREWTARLDRVVEEGKRAGLAVRYRLTDPGKKKVRCTENVENALVVAADGAVAPCVFSNIPAAGATCMEGDTETICERRAFGSLDERRLSAIWRSGGYARFRRSLRKAPPPRCMGCPKLAMG
jgi:MoaA/NifB/PqqE/SkfB family radical SAM enzyme